MVQTNRLNGVHIKSFDQTFSKVCDESRGEEPLVAHRSERNSPGVQAFAGLGAYK